MAYISPMIVELNERSREIFRRIVDTYLESGEPVGSRTLSRQEGVTLSAASIRNIMADLESAGLLFAPHTSAGRLPTELGLRHYVRGVLEVGSLSEEERAQISGQCVASGRSLQQALGDATQMLSGLSRCASLVLAPKMEYPLKHIEFVQLAPGRALVVMVMENGNVENRLIEVPVGLSPSALVEATNYLSYHLVGKTLHDARRTIIQELQQHKAQLDLLTEKVVRSGIASWPESGAHDSLIVRGTSNLLADVTAVEDLERVRQLFELLESKESYAKLLESAESAEGVQIFIGSENGLFKHAGCTLIAAPFTGHDRKVIGTIGVIGPTRLNYARIIPMVDFTAKIVSHMIEGGKNAGNLSVRSAGT